MKMNIILIATGVILITIGIYRILSSQSNKNEVVYVHPKVVVVEKKIHDTVEVETKVKTEVSSNQKDIPPVSEEDASNTNTQASADDAKSKGDAFEDFVVNLLADHRLKLLDRTQDKVSTNGVYAESCKNPDLHVEQKKGNSKVDYYIECKYRSKWNDGKIQFQDWQFDRYRKFQREHKRKVIIALGIGGKPEKPNEFMLVPLDSIKDNTIEENKQEFKVVATSSNFIEYMNSYFNTVFSKSRKTNKPRTEE